MSRVLPTPVASAKQMDGNSRSKSVTFGNSDLMIASAAAASGDLLGGTISVMRSRISSDSRCDGRKLNRPARALTCRFILFFHSKSVRSPNRQGSRLNSVGCQDNFSATHANDLPNDFAARFFGVTSVRA